MLNLTGRVVPPEGLPTATNWSTIQAYYAVYQVTKGLAAAASRDNRLESHPSVQAFYMNYWTDGPRAQLPPWSLMHSTTGPANAPVALQSGVHNWSSIDDMSCWSIAANSLRTTRDDAVAEALKKARRDKAKERNRALPEGSSRKRSRTANLTADERTSTERSVRAFCLIDYLYRLRIRSNYEDVMMWVSGATAEYEPVQIQRSLELITSATLLVSELFIQQKTGRAWFVDQAKTWLSSGGTFQQDREGIKGRLGHY
jgi:hypothetical protein